MLVFSTSPPPKEDVESKDCGKYNSLGIYCEYIFFKK